MMEKLPREKSYGNFAYRVALLAQFQDNEENLSSSSRNKSVSSRFQKQVSSTMDSSTHGRRARSNNAEAFQNHSVHGNNVWDSFKKKSDKRASPLGRSLHMKY